MANIFTIPAGCSVATVAAQHVLATVRAELLSQAVLLVPTRRACVTMRQAFGQLLGDKASLLPRIFPIADLDAELLTLLGAQAFELMETIAPAMSTHEQRYLLGVAVKAFEERRLGAPITLSYALSLADELMELQDDCARAGITLSHEALRPLLYADFATHWEQSLQFLGILSDVWPALEQELGMTIAPTREAKILHALAAAWQQNPPAFPVFAIGSTASHAATAALLQTIATMQNGHVILPGVDVSIPEEEWQAIAVGHPLFHLKQFLERLAISHSEIHSLMPPVRSLWLDVLANADAIAHWKHEPCMPHEHVRMIPCAHAEEETRVIALLLRETLEDEGTCVALVTPDEGLMARVAAHMKRYDIPVDRLSAGTLANTETGSLWQALAACIVDPSRMLLLRHLLQHPLVTIDAEFIRAMEPSWRGVPTQRLGQLPRLPEHLHQHPAAIMLQKMLHDMLTLSRAAMNASAWVAACTEILSRIAPQTGTGHDAVTEALENLSGADRFGAIAIEEFSALLQDAFAVQWREVGRKTHPCIFMLTPAEARLQQFDRVILASMHDGVWPGEYRPSAWLNMSAKAALGLPSPAERTSLMAHDVLMLGSGGEVFMTYPRRTGGAPVARSRFVERLVTLLAAHGVPESSITANHFVDWANALDAAEKFQPEAEVWPLPSAMQRPQQLPVSALEQLFSDPFSVYARYVLQLKSLKEIDAEPEASDFGTLAHKAVHALTTHWNTQARGANEHEMDAIADYALRHFSERPNVALFWRTRLLRALAFVNHAEGERRTTPVPVEGEVNIEARLTLADDTHITLHGRMDRLENTAAGATIADYKTGDTPKEKHMLEGKAVQLLAYGMMMQANGEAVDAISYWQLPHGKTVGDIRSVGFNQLIENELPEKLKSALNELLNEKTPLLARPLAHAERFENDYDGISRYDEWAG